MHCDFRSNLFFLLPSVETWLYDRSGPVVNFYLYLKEKKYKKTNVHHRYCMCSDEWFLHEAQWSLCLAAYAIKLHSNCTESTHNLISSGVVECNMLTGWWFFPLRQPFMYPQHCTKKKHLYLMAYKSAVWLNTGLRVSQINSEVLWIPYSRI